MGARTKANIGTGLTKEQKLALRAERFAGIHGLLAEKRMTTDEIAAAMQLPWATVYTYICLMEQDGQARRSGVFVKRAELWEAGACAVEISKDTPEDQWASLNVYSSAE
jgi:hypothetical protein